MAYSPIAFTAANYRDYKFNWLKAYEPGTTAPKVMATDSTLGTLIAKAEINIDGFIISAGGALITPYIDGSYDLWLFPTEAEADANDTSSALRLADNITGAISLIKDLDRDFVHNEPTLAIAVAATNLLAGDSINVAERTTGDGGGAMWDVVLSSSVTENTYNIVQCTGVPTLSLVLRINGVVDVKQFGAIGDGVTDDTLALSAVFASVTDGSDLSVHFPKPSVAYTITTIISIGDLGEIGRLKITGERSRITTLAGNEGLWFFASATLGPSIECSGIIFDGGGIAQRAFYTHRDIHFYNNEVINFWSETSGAIGIYLFYDEILTGDTVVANIHDNRFEDFGGITTGSVGSAAGSTRAILVKNPELSTATATVNIHNNYFNNFFAREGDIIQVADANPAILLSSSRTTIANNYIGRSNRRAIKIQGWNVTIRNNEFHTISTTDPEHGLDGEGGAGIVSFAFTTGVQTLTTGHIFDGNEIYSKAGLKGCCIFSGGAGVVTNNKFYQPEGGVSFIEGKNGGYFEAYNNTIEQITSLSASISSGSTFSNNTVNMVGGAYVIAPGGSNNTDITISGNTFNIPAGNTGTVLGCIYFINYTSPHVNVLIERNTVNVPQGTDTRTRCKLAYFNGAGNVGDITFAYNLLNSDSSPFRKDNDVNYSYCSFIHNSNQLGQESKMLSPFGDNLFTNSRFETDSTGWDVSAGSSYSSEYRGMLIQTGEVHQSVAVTNGQTYMLRIKIEDLGTTNLNFFLGTTQARTILSSREQSSGEYFIYFDYAGTTGNSDCRMLPTSSDMVLLEAWLYELT